MNAILQGPENGLGGGAASLARPAAAGSDLSSKFAFGVSYDGWQCAGYPLLGQCSGEASHWCDRDS